MSVCRVEKQTDQGREIGLVGSVSVYEIYGYTFIVSKAVNPSISRDIQTLGCRHRVGGINQIN